LSSGGGFGGNFVLLPSSVLVIDGARLEAAVKDPDESVGELAKGGVVADVSSTKRIVVGAGS